MWISYCLLLLNFALQNLRNLSLVLLWSVDIGQHFHIHVYLININVVVEKCFMVHIYIHYALGSIKQVYLGIIYSSIVISTFNAPCVNSSGILWLILPLLVTGFTKLRQNTLYGLSCYWFMFFEDSILPPSCLTIVVIFPLFVLKFVMFGIYM